MPKRAYIIDGHSLAHRCFYALPALTTRGKPMGAVYGFARILLKILLEEKPDYIAVAFDTPGPTFRHQKLAQYKAHRDKTPDELEPQFNDLKKMLEVMGIPIFEAQGYEADDVLGTMAKKFRKQKHEAVIISGDKDTLQLVDEGVRVRYTRKGISDIVDYNLSRIEEEFGLKPSQLIDVKALMGDSSDNIPGVPGIGEKTAIKLIKEFNSLENLLKNIDQVSSKRIRENIRENLEQVKLNQDMVRIRDDLEIKEEELSWQEPEWKKTAILFQDWQFSSLLENLPLGEQHLLKEREEVEYQVIEEEDWISFKNSFEPPHVLYLAMGVEGNRPREYVLSTLALNINDEIFIFRVGKNEKILDFFQEYLEDPRLPKVGHDLKKGASALKDRGIVLEGIKFDTALAVYLLDSSATNPDFPALLERITGHNIPKEGEGQLAGEVNYLPRVEEELEQSLQEYNLTGVLLELELPLIRVLVQMEHNGIKVNLEYLKKLAEELEQRLQGITQEIYTQAGYSFNVNSPKQLGKVLFEELKMPVIRKTKTGYSTGADVLEKLKGQHPIIQYILEQRQLSKLKSTYIDALPPLVNSSTGRLHTSFHQMVTATGRLSSSEPNLQNIPVRSKEGQKIRRAFVARPGCLLLAADYSQIELRILAHMAGEERLQESFRRGEDIHTRTASEVFSINPEEVTSEHRRRAKVINFGIAYGMSPYGLAQDLDVSQEEAAAYIDLYFSRYPAIKEYIDSCIESAREKGFVTTIMNRMRYLPDINHRVPHRRGFAERMAINTPIQGSGADIMKLAMVQVEKELRDMDGVYMLLQVHDELVFEVQEDKVEQLAILVKREMEEVYELQIPLVVDLKVGSNWMDMESFSIKA